MRVTVKAGYEDEKTSFAKVKRSETKFGFEKIRIGEKVIVASKKRKNEKLSVKPRNKSAVVVSKNKNIVTIQYESIQTKESFSFSEFQCGDVKFNRI
jgi:hypothetical protein